MDTDLFSSHSHLMMAWFFGLVFTAVTAIAAGIFPKKLEAIRKVAIAVMIFPGLAVALVYAAQGFAVLDRPIVHWIFAKDSPDALRVGLVFDLLSFVVSVFFGVALLAIGWRNRPSIRVSAALSLSWVAVGLAATAQTLWLVALGIGIQLFSRALPLIDSGAEAEPDDSRWVAPVLRGWLGLLFVLVGGVGMAAQGIHLDFFSDVTWPSAESSVDLMISGGLLIFGLLLMAAPAFASHVLFSKGLREIEERVFISEASLTWIAVIVFYRLFSSLHDPSWLLAIGIGACIATTGSILSLPFQTSRGSAIHLWLSTLPIATLMFLPFVPAREATLGILGAIITFSGLWISLDHPRTKVETAAAAAFFLGTFGFAGWSTSAPLAAYFSKIEMEPVLRGFTFLVLLLFSSFGWRLVLRGGDREERISPAAKWIALGIFFLVGFGPLLSGRWGGGGIPGEGDWIEGAKNWAWIHSDGSDGSALDWFGFGIAQSLGLIAIIIGTFAWRQADLFPFAKNYPRAARAAEGLFGLIWLGAATSFGIRRLAQFWVRAVSSKIWEVVIPKVVNSFVSAFRRLGSSVETATDAVTSSGYARVFAPAAKFVQWLHGGDVRLYAWFALIWILIFSIYLAR